MMIISPNHNPEAAEMAHPGSFWMAIFSLSLILIMLVAVGAFILRLRHRARNPLPEPTSLEEILDGEEQDSSRPSSWEQKEDWWKGD
ncbi:MAG: hypothetical protein AAGH89_12740 [Verrucomicrobiota bacterium]